MRPFRHLQFALDSAWQSFWRNAAVSTAAVGSITLIMMLGGTSLLLGHALSQLLDTYKQRVSVISISVADDTPLPAVYDFEDRLRSRPQVVSARAPLMKSPASSSGWAPVSRSLSVMGVCLTVYSRELF